MRIEFEEEKNGLNKETKAKLVFFKCNTSYALEMYKNHYTIYSFFFFFSLLLLLLLVFVISFNGFNDANLHLPAEKL